MVYRGEIIGYRFSELEGNDEKKYKCSWGWGRQHVAIFEKVNRVSAQ
jgi:hypothetical protein